MSSSNPTLIVRVAATLEELRANLAEGRSQIETTTAAMGKMAASFSGDKLMQQANNVMAALTQVNGITSLTGAEQARVNNILERALEKYRVLGKEAPVGMQQVADATKGAASNVDKLRGSFSAFDGVLKAMGINIGPEVSGLLDLGDASGKTASQLGMVATAGLVVGAGVAGWKIGRAVSEFFDLDTVIGNATAKLLGWGDAAAEAAGSKADALARASKIIGFEVLSLSTAMEINSWSQAKFQSNAEKSATTVSRWKAELAKMPADLDQLTKDLDSQNFSVADLAKKYGLSVDAIQFFVREQKKAAAAAKETGDAIHDSNARMVKDLQGQIDAAKPFRDAMGELNSAGQGWKGTLDTIDGSVVEAIKFYLKAGVSQADLAIAYDKTAAQVKAVASALRDEADATKQAIADTAQLTKAQKDFNDELERKAAIKSAEKKEKDVAAAAAAKDAKTRHDMGGSTEYDLTTEAGRRKVPEDVRGWLHNGWSFEQANLLAYSIRMGFDATRDPILQQKGPAVPGFREGGIGDFGSGTLAMLHGREAIIPLDRAGGGVTHVTNVYVTQPLGTPTAIAAAVDAALMKRQRDTGARF